MKIGIYIINFMSFFFFGFKFKFISFYGVFNLKVLGFGFMDLWFHN
jgi:hypothetical protein